MCLFVPLQTSDTTLEEFLEELDALTEAVAEEDKDRVSTVNASTGQLPLSTSEDETAGLVSAAVQKEDSPPRTSEKKVRFSEEFLQPAHTRKTAPSQDSTHLESSCLSSLNAPSPHTEALEHVPQDQGGCPPAPPVAEEQSSEGECPTTGSSPSESSSPPSADREPGSAQESSVHPAELSKCNINSTNAGETRLLPFW